MEQSNNVCKYCLEEIFIREHQIYPCLCKTPVCLMCISEYLHMTNADHCEICLEHYTFEDNIAIEIHDYSIGKAYEEYRKTIETQNIIEPAPDRFYIKLFYAISFIILFILSSAILVYLAMRFVK